QLFDELASRRHVTAVVQFPLLSGLWLGVSDLRWLARLFSLGMMGAPTALYSLALVRARNDAAVLATTIAAVAMVFMTTSMFIVGEYNTAHAAVILAAVWLATADRLRAADGLVLVAVAVLSLRAYETVVFLGPLLALMTADAIRRAPSRPTLASGLYGAAAALFVCATAFAAHSLITYSDEAYLATLWAERWGFGRNLQFELVVAAAAVVVVWALMRPDDLLGCRPYWLPGFLLALVALSPLTVFLKVLMVPPYAFAQELARFTAAAVTAVVVVFLWGYKSAARERPRAAAILKMPAASRRLLAFACLMLAAVLPWDVVLTQLHTRYLEEVRLAIRAQSGIIAFESSSLGSHPRLMQGHDWALPVVSLVLRATPADGILAPPHGEWSDEVFPPSSPPDLGRFRWRD
ncbi:MAG: hypothetical protein ACHQK9_13230, partial [Reyranellales bacterium]